MQQSVTDTIIMLARNDPETTAEQLDALKDVCAGRIQSHERVSPLVTTEKAREILGGITCPTLRKLERDGKIHRVKRYTKRIFYLRSEVEKLAYDTTVMAE